MSSEVEIEVSKLLYSSFGGEAAGTVGMTDLARIWSLEMQWFTPEIASELVGRLHLAGWLAGEADSVRAHQSCFLHPPELGWRPFLSRFNEIPHPPNIEITEGQPSSVSSQPIVEHPPQTQIETPEKGVLKLASRVASMSGLERREVIRRAERKRRALGPVTMEMSILLLAREQNLDMEELVEISD